jgi:hypothetical protein
MPYELGDKDSVMTATITFDIPLLYFVALTVIGILIYVLMVKNRSRRRQASAVRMTREILGYFQGMGCEIGLQCVSLKNDDHFIAFIDTEPMKRFRVSHKLEAALMQHVRVTCQSSLDSVYWRFIVKEGEQEDHYLRDGLAVYELEESTLEEFQAIANSQQVSHMIQ